MTDVEHANATHTQRSLAIHTPEKPRRCESGAISLTRSSKIFKLARALGRSTQGFHFRLACQDEEKTFLAGIWQHSVARHVYLGTHVRNQVPYLRVLILAKSEHVLEAQHQENLHR